MSGLLKKRGREEADEVFVEPKRFREAEKILFDDNDSEEKNEQEEEGAPSEELLSGVIRSLEEEIGVSCSTSYEGSDSSGLSRDGSVVSDMTSGCGAPDHGVDIDYLLGASDDELGILPSPVLDDSVQREGVSTALEFENPVLTGFSSDNWHFEDDFVDYQQFGYIEGPAIAAAAAALDFSHDVFVDGDYSTAWRLETAGGMY